MISVENISKSYGAVEALRGISFEVGKGEIVGLLGPNGAGKTTAMKVLTGYLQPTGGSAKVGGIDVVDDPLGVQRIVGYLPENAPLWLDMTVQEYLGLMAELRGIPPAERRARISEAVHDTNLAEQLIRPIGSLSKGFRQRVCLAQAILHRPSVLILDEPTNGLDPTQIVEIRGLVRRLARESTVIVSTHILSEVEASCHRAIIIMNGQIKADARLADLKSTSSAVAAIEARGEDPRPVLAALPGIRRVEREMGRYDRPGSDGGFSSWRITAEHEMELCPLVYDTARERGWRLAELRAEVRTLESVFRELAEKEVEAA
jgi:ABC-2 type transport system ATP-binding protein